MKVLFRYRNRSFARLSNLSQVNEALSHLPGRDLKKCCYELFLPLTGYQQTDSIERTFVSIPENILDIIISIVCTIENQSIT